MLRELIRMHRQHAPLSVLRQPVRSFGSRQRWIELAKLTYPRQQIESSYLPLAESLAAEAAPEEDDAPAGAVPASACLTHLPKVGVGLYSQMSQLRSCGSLYRS